MYRSSLALPRSNPYWPRLRLPDLIIPVLPELEAAIEKITISMGIFGFRVRRGLHLSESIAMRLAAALDLLLAAGLAARQHVRCTEQSTTVAIGCGGLPRIQMRPR